MSLRSPSSAGKALRTKPNAQIKQLARRQDQATVWWTPSPGDGAYSDYIADSATDDQAAEATQDWQSLDAVESSWEEPAPVATTSSAPMDAAPTTSSAAAQTTSSISGDEPVPSSTPGTSSVKITSSSQTSEPASSSSQETAESDSSSSAELFSKDQIKAVSVTDLPSSSGTSSKNAASRSSSSIASSATHDAALKQENFFRTIGSNPTYIGLTVLVSCTVAICLAAMIACCLRRRRNRQRASEIDPFASVFDRHAQEAERRESYGSDDSIFGGQEMRENDWTAPQSTMGWTHPPHPQPAVAPVAADWSGQQAAYALPASVKPLAHLAQRAPVPAPVVPFAAAGARAMPTTSLGGYVPLQETDAAPQRDRFTQFKRNNTTSETSLRRKMQKQRAEEERLKQVYAIHRQAMAPSPVQTQTATVQRMPSDASSIYTASSYHSEVPAPAPATAQIPRYRNDTIRRTDNRSSWEYLMEDQTRTANKASQALRDRVTRSGQAFYC